MSGSKGSTGSNNKDPWTSPLLAFLVPTPFFRSLILWTFCRDPVDMSGIPAAEGKGGTHQARLSSC